ncbi:MAG: serine hydrolase [Pseudomonadales bacterium]
MKKLAIGLLGLLIAILVYSSFVLGMGPRYIFGAPSMSVGMGAKLACSSRYVTGMPAQLAADDLLVYSPLFNILSYDFDDKQQHVTASVLGLRSASAQFYPGFGCVLDIGDTNYLASVTAPVSPSTTGLWPQGDEVGELDVDLQKTLSTIMRRDNEAGLQTRALLVVRDGQVAAESYAEGFDENSMLLGWSMAKSITALMIGNLEMKGLIQAELSPVFQQWENDARADITLTDMLHMSSGLDFIDIYEPGTEATQMLFEVHSASDLAITSKSVLTAGKHFEYSSGTTNLLSRLVYDRTGSSLQASLEYLESEIRRPLGLQDFILEPDPSGVFVGSSYLYASARDWARFGQLMLNKGVLNGNRLVTEDWVKRAVTPNESENTKAYGYQFWLNQGDEQLRWSDLPQDSYAARGNNDQTVMTIPSANVVIVRLGWTKSGYPENENFSEILDSARK